MGEQDQPLRLDARRRTDRCADRRSRDDVLERADHAGFARLAAAADRRAHHTDCPHAARRGPVVRPLPLRLAHPTTRGDVRVGIAPGDVHSDLDGAGLRVRGGELVLGRAPGHGLDPREMNDDQPPALRYDQRPPDRTPIHTDALPATPTRDRNIVATAWVEAPTELLNLGADLPGHPEAEYKRRIGNWLLWRAGPAAGGDARYWAGRSDDLAGEHTFRPYPDHNGGGLRPNGRRHPQVPAGEGKLLGRCGARAVELK